MLKIKKRNILFFVSFFLVASFLFINEVNAASVDFAGNDNQLILINEKQIFEGEQINCEDFVYTEGEANAISNYNLVQELFSLIMLLGPVLLIVFGTLDFAKAVLSGDESALKKAGTNFGKRILALILLFLIPFIISILLKVAFDAGVFGEGLSEIPSVCITE
ncbi:MAG: hypothetical protein PHO58_00730 [Bacilli bacterium]|nr:hypothetical protein [Bacilli bacterium]